MSAFELRLIKSNVDSASSAPELLVVTISMTVLFAILFKTEDRSLSGKLRSLIKVLIFVITL